MRRLDGQKKVQAVRPPAVCAAEDCNNPLPERRMWNQIYCSKTCNHRTQQRKNDRKTRFGAFGADLSDYDRLFIEQEGRCAICGSTDPGGREGIKRFAFDHDHKASRPRGLLCYLCNVGLGSFQDDPALLQAAIRYLETHSGAAINPRPDATAEAVTPLGS